jgi:hypothetical protein
MTYIVFTDTSLSKCVSITNQKAKYTDFSKINLKDEIHVILPNEILSLVSNDNEMTNKSNIEASIINTIATNSLKDIENLKILETSSSRLYHVISAENLQQLKQKFSTYDGKLKISSDLSYFKDLNTNIEFEGACYIYDEDKPIKLLNSSYQLLENNKELKKLKLTDLTFNPSNIASSELNTLNLVEVVSPKNTKKYLYALVGIVVILNIAGLINITSNYNQINTMNNTIEKIYNEIYPNDSSTNIQTSIANKFLELNSSQTSTFTQIKRLINNIPASVNVVDVYVDLNEAQSIQITYLFENEVDESLFINNLQRSNIKNTIESREELQGFTKTSITYEL